MKVPVIVLSGFLGSGKTTLLQRLLLDARNRSLSAAVLMNELGSYDVDGQMLKGALPDEQLEKLMDGCICCSKKSEISASLNKLLSGSPDLIIIELTGVANPEEIADALTEPSVIRQVFLHSIVTVVNADMFLEYNSILNPDRELTHTLRRQVETADFIIINKIDLVTENTLVKVEKSVRSLNRTAPIRPTTGADISPDYIFKEIAPRPKSNLNTEITVHLNKGKSPVKSFNVIKQDHSDPIPENQYSFSKIKTMAIPLNPAVQLSSKELMQAAKSWGKGLLRAKGYVPVDGKLRLVQFSGGKLSIEPTNEETAPYFVIIGFEEDVVSTMIMLEKRLNLR
ncbi:CobW family GTP-binding protein [Paenibacillus alkalitolerans]|uniref:CobW family GTP-binding protein n=1 Tax=Paenibacillus alkalitolerans TaxID=2799335 RepID=UPI0018F293A0|nr:GTP-binding protein [Paenibacillus alkalitolerans]